MLRLEFFIAAILVCLLAGCATTSQMPGVAFNAESPAEGMARLYLFRPGFSKISNSDSPKMSIDGKDVMDLEYESYTNLSLKPGTYKLSLKSGRFESSVWDADWRLSIESGKIYFLAIWNQVSQEQGLTFVQIFAPKPVLLPWIGNVTVNKQLRYELVSEKDAEFLLSTLKYIKPSANDFAPAL